jgi:hypothetical protein
LLKTEYYGVLDTGRGLNTRFMFAKDPGLESIVRAVPQNAINWDRMLERAVQ